MVIVRPVVLSTPSALRSRPVGVGLRALMAPAASPRSAAVTAPPAWTQQRPTNRGGAAPGVPLCVSLLLLIAAALVAPEQPHDQAAICQRQSGEVACRVW
jgi:hypothetical protein